MARRGRLVGARWQAVGATPTTDGAFWTIARRASALLAVALLLLPAATLAHAGERGFIMLLPTELYVGGGTLVVALTFLAVTLLRPGLLEPLAAARCTTPWSRIPDLAAACGFLTLALLIGLIVAGFAGSSDPLRNPISTTVWSLLWLGMAFVQAVLGDVWRALSPWPALHRLLGGGALRAYPAWLGYWPAVIGLFALVWFENISLAPMDPPLLATVLGAYLVYTALAMRLFGATAWLEHGEVLSVYFRMLAWLSPLDWQVLCDAGVRRLRVVLCWPGARLAALPSLAPSLMGFVLLALAAVSFDGLSHTFRWVSAVGLNPLAFPGRSAVQTVNSAGLLASFLVLAGAYLACMQLASRLAVEAGGDRPELTRAALVTLVPIAFAYHLAHYLPAFLVEAQYALRALSDPLGRGWNLIGTGGLRVMNSLRSHGPYIENIWFVQVGAIVAGHVLAVLLGHLILERAVPGRRRRLLAAVPLTGLMIGYTFLGLWLLATPSL